MQYDFFSIIILVMREQSHNLLTVFSKQLSWLTLNHNNNKKKTVQTMTRVMITDEEVRNLNDEFVH